NLPLLFFHKNILSGCHFDLKVPYFYTKQIPESTPQKRDTLLLSNSITGTPLLKDQAISP
ncbi:hypothetical protein, partial [Odoribacter laneus]|uniref:hypothetical protein n=1 Tax=Odoribacter laneus TaxID=626933 RepID=UPI003AAD892D